MEIKNTIESWEKSENGRILKTFPWYKRPADFLGSLYHKNIVWRYIVIGLVSLFTAGVFFWFGSLFKIVLSDSTDFVTRGGIGIVILSTFLLLTKFLFFFLESNFKPGLKGDALLNRESEERLLTMLADNKKIEAKYIKIILDGILNRGTVSISALNAIDDLMEQDLAKLEQAKFAEKNRDSLLKTRGIQALENRISRQNA